MSLSPQRSSPTVVTPSPVEMLAALEQAARAAIEQLEDFPPPVQQALVDEWVALRLYELREKSGVALALKLLQMEDTISNHPEGFRDVREWCQARGIQIPSSTASDVAFIHYQLRPRLVTWGLEKLVDETMPSKTRLLVPRLREAIRNGNEARARARVHELFALAQEKTWDDLREALYPSTYQRADDIAPPTFYYQKVVEDGRVVAVNVIATLAYGQFQVFQRGELGRCFSLAPVPAEMGELTLRCMEIIQNRRET